MKNWIRKILCRLGYHKYLYDHPTQPIRCTCTNCNRNWRMVKNPDYIPNKSNPFETPIFVWEEIKD